MKILQRLALVAGIVSGLTPSSFSAPVVVNAGDVLEIKYRFLREFSSEPNALGVGVVTSPSSPQPSGRARWEYFDGSRSLLSFETPYNHGGTAYSQSYPVGGLGLRTMDFSPILSRSGGLRMRMTLLDGSPLVFDPSKMTYPGLLDVRAEAYTVGTSSMSFSGGDPLVEGVFLNSSTVYRSKAPDARLFGVAIGQNDGAEIRGDLGAEAVFDLLSKNPAWASAQEGNPSSALVFSGPPELNDDIASSVRTSMLGQLESIRRNVRDGDTVVFYASAHGGKIRLANQPESDGAEEYLSFGVTDDALAEYFSNPQWDRVRKIFLIDACYSGGFWGTTSTDEGDLNRLKNVAVLTASKESQDAYGTPSSGMGLWTYLALLPALEDATLTVGQLRNSIANSWLGRATSYVGLDLPLLGLNEFGLYEPGSFETVSALPEPTFFFSGDFDLGQPLVLGQTAVPEPATLALSLLAMFVLWSQRHREPWVRTCGAALAKARTQP